jgi:hypothetical protein
VQIERLLHHRTHIVVELVDVRFIAELLGDVDRFDVSGAAVEVDSVLADVDVAVAGQQGALSCCSCWVATIAAAACSASYLPTARSERPGFACATAIFGQLCRCGCCGGATTGQARDLPAAAAAEQR